MDLRVTTNETRISFLHLDYYGKLWIELLVIFSKTKSNGRSLHSIHRPATHTHAYTPTRVQIPTILPVTMYQRRWFACWFTKSSLCFCNFWNVTRSMISWSVCFLFLFFWLGLSPIHNEYHARNRFFPTTMRECIFYRAKRKTRGAGKPETLSSLGKFFFASIPRQKQVTQKRRSNAPSVHNSYFSREPRKKEEQEKETIYEGSMIGSTTEDDTTWDHGRLLSLRSSSSSSSSHEADDRNKNDNNKINAFQATPPAFDPPATDSRIRVVPVAKLYRGRPPHEKSGLGSAVGWKWDLDLSKNKQQDDPLPYDEMFDGRQMVAQVAGSQRMKRSSPDNDSIRTDGCDTQGRPEHHSRAQETMTSTGPSLITGTPRSFPNTSSTNNKTATKRPMVSLQGYATADDKSQVKKDFPSLNDQVASRVNASEQHREGQCETLISGLGDKSMSHLPGSSLVVSGSTRGLHLLGPPGRIIPMPLSTRTTVIEKTTDDDNHDEGFNIRNPMDKSTLNNVQSLPPPPPQPIVQPFVSVATISSAMDISSISSLSGHTSGLQSLPPPPPSSSPSITPTIQGVPKQILHQYYINMPCRVQLCQNDYYTWNDGGMDHCRRYTSIFLCPVTGERYPSCRWGKPDTYDVRTDDHAGGGPVVWYRQKKSAEHAAAARACDCLCYRFAQVTEPRLGHDPPYYVESDLILPTIPADIEARIERRRSSTQNRIYW